MPAIPDNHAAGAKTRAQHPECFELNSSGMVLIVVVILAAAAGILAAGLYFSSSAWIKQVQQEVRFEKAFFVAEAGIEHAKAELYTFGTNLYYVLRGPDGLTNTPDDGMLSFCPTNGTNYGNGRFYVKVRNNVTKDPNPFMDTDYIVIIRSTGIVENVKRVIEAEVRVIPWVPPIFGDSAFGLQGTNTSLTLGGNAVIDGHNWNLPADFTKTMGAHGNGTTNSYSTNDMPGVLYGTTNTVITNSGNSSITGNPVTSNGASIYNPDYWSQFLTAVMSAATVFTNDSSMGTRSNPIITLMPAGTTDLGSNAKGAGVLIIPSGATVSIGGTFYYEGLILFVGSGTFSKTVQNGTVSIFGSMICIDGQVNMTLTGDSFILFSKQAYDDLTRLSVPAKMETIYWKEIKASSTNW